VEMGWEEETGMNRHTQPTGKTVGHETRYNASFDMKKQPRGKPGKDKGLGKKKIFCFFGEKKMAGAGLNKLDGGKQKC